MAKISLSIPSKIIVKLLFSRLKSLHHCDYKTYKTDPIDSNLLSPLKQTQGPCQKLIPASIDLVTLKNRNKNTYLKILQTQYPGRLILGGYSSPTERISTLVNESHQPIVEILPSFVQDTNYNHLQELKKPLSPGPILVTTDVVAHKHPPLRLSAALNYLLSDRSPNAVIALAGNYFSFQYNTYHQKNKTTIDTQVAPSCLY